MLNATQNLLLIFYAVSNSRSFNCMHKVFRLRSIRQNKMRGEKPKWVVGDFSNHALFICLHLSFILPLPRQHPACQREPLENAMFTRALSSQIPRHDVYAMSFNLFHFFFFHISFQSCLCKNTQISIFEHLITIVYTGDSSTYDCCL